MPVFEYKCKKCEHVFEELVKGGQSIKCPKCAGQVTKMFSTFSTSGSGKNMAGTSACSGCTSGDCSSCT